MIPLYGRPPTPLERFQNFFSTHSPYWFIKIMRFLVYVVESVIRFIVNLFREAIRNLMGKY